jgi:hypothetical protein
MPSELMQTASRLLSTNLVTASRVYGGGNSQVYRLTDRRGSFWCGKVYAAPKPGRQDRMETEWRALSFLWDHGKRFVPQPVARDDLSKIAIYQWIEGSRFTDRLIAEPEVRLAVSLLRELDEISEVSDAGQLPVASEAFFSIEDIRQNLTARGRRLQDSEGSSPEHESMRQFVAGELTEARERFTERARVGYRSLGRDPQQILPHAERVLSPSDFGFHNALDSSAGVMWLDFEYFGWDDPAKTMADFVLHPAMKMSDEARRLFWQDVACLLGRGDDLALRARWLYPLHGVQWCLIILNEFLREDLERRLLASGQDVTAQDLRARQLDKARQLLKTVIEHDKSFPYH